jgi:hypothetical protein
VRDDDNDNDPPHWYVRRGTTIQGPYDVDTLRRYLLLGRVRVTDGVSSDGETWQPLTQRAELIPEEMKDLGSPEGRARFEAARQAIDERAGGDDGIAGWRWPPRRRQTDPLPGAPSVRMLLTAAAVAAAVVFAAIGYREAWLHGPGGPPDCEAAPAPGVNWSYCTKDELALSAGADLSEMRAVNASLRGADLSGVDLREATLVYADLTGAKLAGAQLDKANLEGAVLRGAGLRGASLAGAELAHADLRDARIEGADFTGADLNNVVWPDGANCHSVAPEGACPD